MQVIQILYIDCLWANIVKVKNHKEFCLFLSFMSPTFVFLLITYVIFIIYNKLIWIIKQYNVSLKDLHMKSEAVTSDWYKSSQTSRDLCFCYKSNTSKQFLTTYIFKLLFKLSYLIIMTEVGSLGILTKES